jgi:glucosyl-dolichyl phosphate glucuronosyltransferase
VERLPVVTRNMNEASLVDFSVVICAYSLERWPDLVEAVTSLDKQVVRPAQIVVVVDHNDALLERVHARLPAVTAVANRGRRGLSGARNTGLAEATQSVVAFLDDDAVAEPDWLARLQDGYQDPDVLGIGGAVLPRWDAGRRPRWFPAEFDWVVGCSYRGLPTHPASVRNLIGANMSYRRHVLNAVGGFREGIGRVGTRPLGCEETDLSIRALQRFPSGRVRYDPSARVVHRVPRSRSGVRYFASRCYAEGLSKALVSQSVGTVSGLSSELTYTLRTLPRGVLTGFVDGLRGDVAGFGRAAAICLGLMITTVGYLIGVMLQKTGRAMKLEPRIVK